MEPSTEIVDRITAKLAARAPMGDAERAAIAALPLRVRTLPQSGYLVREGQVPQRCAFLVEGFAFRQKLTTDGQREIVSILVPGDFVDVQNLFLDESDHDVQALTRMTVAEVPIASLRDLTVTYPAIARALWIDALVEASTYREWLLNVGRRSARVRLAHLLCEFGVRLSGPTSKPHDYELPMTQEQLGDTLGLTPVHVNRVLKMLESEGLITRNKRQVAIVDWDRLRGVGEFNERYLHSTQMLA